MIKEKCKKETILWVTAQGVSVDLTDRVGGMELRLISQNALGADKLLEISQEFAFTSYQQVK